MWPVKALGDIVENGELPYGVVQPGPDTSGGVPIVRVKDLRDGRVDEGQPHRVAQEISRKHQRTLLQGGELLLSIVGTVGEAAVAPATLAGWNVARAIAVIRPSGVSAEWVRLCLQIPETRDSFNAMLNTTVQATLNLTDLRRLQIPIPPEAHRRGIEDVVGAMDDKIAANATIVQTADQLARLVFERFVVDHGTTSMPLGSVATLVLGGTPSRARADYWMHGSVPWLNSGKANEDRVISPSDLITPDALANSAAKLMPVGATILAITGATLGQVARLEIEAAGNQSLIGIWASSAPLTDWIHFAVRREIPQLLRSATGAAQQHVNKQAVAALSIPLADEVAIESFGAVTAPLLARAAEAAKESKALAAVRDALLPQLMSGKIRVRDAERVVEGVV